MILDIRLSLLPNSKLSSVRSPLINLIFMSIGYIFDENEPLELVLSFMKLFMHTRTSLNTENFLFLH